MFKYRKLKGYKYQILENYTYLDSGYRNYSSATRFITVWGNGAINIGKGYAWDGATGFPDFKWIIKASLVHDALCQLIHHDKTLPPIYRKLADRLLRKMCIEDGSGKFMAGLVYFGVRMYVKLRYGKGY